MGGPLLRKLQGDFPLLRLQGDFPPSRLPDGFPLLRKPLDKAEAGGSSPPSPTWTYGSTGWPSWIPSGRVPFPFTIRPIQPE
jgi:hypothetical protein